MGLRFGWIASAAVDSHWPGDPAFLDDPDDKGVVKSRIPESAMEQWRNGGYAAEHLAPYARQDTKPERITYRQLTADEAAYCEGLQYEGQTAPGFNAAGYLRACEAAGRIVVDFPDAPIMVEVSDGSGARMPRIGRVGAFPGLSDGFSRALRGRVETAGLLFHYGRAAYEASKPTEAEKKA